MGTFPKLRIAGFTDAWEQRKFGSLLNETRDKTTEEDQDILLSCAIDGMYLNSELFSHFRGSSNIGYLKIKKNDLILSTQNLHLGNCNVNLRFDHGIISPAYKVFELVDCDPLFMQAWVKQDASKNFFLKASTEGASVCRKNIVWEDLYKQELPIPDITEQKKIGAFFSNFDSLITLHQRKCDALKTAKKYFLQNMFPSEGEMFPKIRLAGFTDAWEQRKLSDLAKFSKGSGYSKGDLREEGTPIILYGRLYTQYQMIISEVDTFAETKDGSVFSKGGEVIVPASGETAEDISIASVVEKSGVLLGGDLNVITPADFLDSAFLAISISNGKPHNDMSKMAQGKSVVHLHNSDLAKVVLPYPCYEEQRRIGEFFSGIDNLITLHQRKCDALKNAKKFFLQNMFV